MSKLLSGATKNSAAFEILKYEALSTLELLTKTSQFDNMPDICTMALLLSQTAYFVKGHVGAQVSRRKELLTSLQYYHIKQYLNVIF